MRFFCVFCVLCGFALPALALEREAFTITKYDLEVRIEPDQQRLGARGKITLRNDSPQPQKVAVLQVSSSLDWRSIKVDGKLVQFVSQPFASDVDHTGALSEAIVTLPAEIKPRDSVDLEIGYEGVIPLDTTRLTQVGVPEELAKHTSWDRISPVFTAVRGAGYVAWYPIATESADFSEGNSLFEVTERWKKREAASAMTVVLCPANTTGSEKLGLMGDSQPSAVPSNASGRSEISCSHHRFEPVGADAPTFVIANFKSERLADVELASLSGHENGASKYAQATEPAKKFVTEWFGAPATKVAIADMADSKAAPFESGHLLLSSMAEEDSNLAATNTVHMLVHSAFNSPRPWVNEGLAHFTEAIYREKSEGREAAIVLLSLHQAPFMDSEKDVMSQKASGKPLAATFDEAYYRSKAAYVWWMLRDMVGDEALKQAIHNYRASDDTDPKYVEKLIESASKRDLGWFFDDWVYQDRGVPDFRVQSVHPWKSENGIQIVTVTLENLGPAGAEVPFTVQCADGQVVRKLELRAKSTASTRVELPCGDPVQVVVNDGSVPDSDLTNNIFRIEK